MKSSHKFLIALAMVLTLALSFSALAVFAAETDEAGITLDETQTALLIQVRNHLQTIDDLEERGVVTKEAAEIQRQRYMTQSQTIVGQEVEVESLNKLLADLEVPTAKEWGVMDKVKGYFTFINIIMTLAGITIVVGLAWCFIVFILPFIRAVVPLFVYEILLYAICVGTINYGIDGANVYVAFIGCLGLIGGIAFSHFLHEHIFEEFYRTFKVNPGTIISFILCIIWGVVAIKCNSKLIGFISVVALEAFLGFFVAVIPWGYVIGFEDEKVIPRAMTASFAILLAYMVQTTGLASIPYFEVFSTGALWMGAFVYFLGLLIVSSRYYISVRKPLFWWIQLLTIVSGFLALWLGSIWGVHVLRGVGGTFFALYLIEKYIEMSRVKEHWALFTLGLGLILWGWAEFMKTHPEYFLVNF